MKRRFSRYGVAYAWALALGAALILGLNGFTGADGKATAADVAKEKDMRITVKAHGDAIVFELNDSQAAKDLLAQLPLSIGVENYSSNEKIFYPPKKLKTDNTPLVRSASMGTLAYYAPWGDVVMFYGSFGSAAGLYELGHAVKGGECIKTLSGTITIEGS